MARVTQIDRGNFPFTGTVEERLSGLIGYAVQAPSIVNSQPWKFVIRDGGIDVYADKTRQLLVADPDGREMTISVGSAIYLLKLAMRCHLMEPDLRYLPENGRPDLLARIVPAGDASPNTDELHLFDQTFRRHTASGALEDIEPSQNEIAALTRAAEEEGVRLRWIGSDHLRAKVVEIVHDANALLFQGEQYREEFASWMRSNQSNAEDGIPGYADGHGSVAAAVAPAIVKSFDVSEALARQERRRASEAPELAVVTTRTDEVGDWLDAGQALCHLQLKAAELKIVTAPFNQPLEVPGLRLALSRETGFCAYPQALLRIGFGWGAGTPRRPLSEVLQTDSAG
jgi:hypothetical protein